MIYKGRLKFNQNTLFIPELEIVVMSVKFDPNW